MDYIEKIIGYCIRTIRIICSLMLALMLVITSLHVFFRYVLNNPLVWSEEVSLLLLVWFGFFSVSNELYKENHIAILMFYDKFPMKMKKVVDVIRHIIISAFCGVMIKYLLIITKLITGNTLPVSGLPKTLLYLPVIVSSGLMLFYSITLLIKTLRDDYSRKGNVN